MIRFRQEEGAGGEQQEQQQQPDPQQQQQQEAPAYSGPSQEEWTAAQETIKQLTGIVPTVQQIASYIEQANQGQGGDDELDLDEYIEQEIQKRMAPIMPIVNTAAQRSGEERMKAIFAEQEAELKTKFDHKLAERAAHSFFQEHGDPQKAVIDGAKYAAEVRRMERDEAVKEYKESLKRPGPSDPPVDAGGNRSIPVAKTYDEVIERYAGQTEV